MTPAQMMFIRQIQFLEGNLSQAHGQFRVGSVDPRFAVVLLSGRCRIAESRSHHARQDMRSHHEHDSRNRHRDRRASSAEDRKQAAEEGCVNQHPPQAESPEHDVGGHSTMTRRQGRHDDFIMGATASAASRRRPSRTVSLRSWSSRTTMMATRAGPAGLLRSGPSRQIPNTLVDLPRRFENPSCRRGTVTGHVPVAARIPAYSLFERSLFESLPMSSCVLAYSGGLDTSVILGWLQDQGYEVHCVYVDLGQPCEDRDAILEKARRIGAASAQAIVATEELCHEFAFPVLQWQAKYEGIYLLGTSIARPLIAKVCLQVARDVGAVAFAHGATGKGNDQCRFQLAAEALNPEVTVIAPWRDATFRGKFPGRSEMIAYCEEKQIPVKATAAQPYSSDENCLHISYEAGALEDPNTHGAAIIEFGMSVSPQEAPDEVESVRIGFRAGIPRTIDGTEYAADALVRRLNKIAGRNGIGRIDIVENRFVGMKSRGVYEAPGMTVLYAAHLAVEQLTLDRDLVHLRDRLAPEVAEMVYYGFWYAPKFDALLAFIREAQRPVTGEVTLGLYKGNVEILGRSSPHSLYDADVASMEGGGSYNQDDAEGFLRIMGLPGRVQGHIIPRDY